MSEGVEYITSKLPLFSTKKDWVQWSEIFLARAKRKGYKNLLVGEETVIPKSGQDKYTESEQKIIGLNEQAYGDLISAMDMKKEGGKVAFNLIRATKTSEYKEGNVKLAWKNLENKYNPKTAPCLTKIHREFFGSKLGSKRNDPDTWITHLEELRTQMEEMGSKIDNRQFMVHILNNLTADYEHTVLMLEQKLGKSQEDATLTLEELREAVNLKFERMNSGREQCAGNNNAEHALTATNGKRCGKIGHIVQNCCARDNIRGQISTPKNNNKKGNNGKKFNGECHYCHKKGHKRQDCYKYQNDQRANNRNEVAKRVVLTIVDIQETH